MNEVKNFLKWLADQQGEDDCQFSITIDRQPASNEVLDITEESVQNEIFLAFKNRKQYQDKKNSQ